MEKGSDWRVRACVCLCQCVCVCVCLCLKKGFVQHGDASLTHTTPTLRHSHTCGSRDHRHREVVVGFFPPSFRVKDLVRQFLLSGAGAEGEPMAQRWRDEICFTPLYKAPVDMCVNCVMMLMLLTACNFPAHPSRAWIRMCTRLKLTKRCFFCHDFLFDQLDPT